MRIAIMVSSILVASLMSAFAQASCVIEPLQPELKAADIVYVGTVVRSELVPSVDSLRDIKRPRDHLVEIKHTVVPRIVLKGNPEKALAVLSTWQYNDPFSNVEVEFENLRVGFDSLPATSRKSEKPTPLRGLL